MAKNGRKERSELATMTLALDSRHQHGLIVVVVVEVDGISFRCVYTQVFMSRVTPYTSAGY
jgi:hypothetical protein